MRCPSAQKYDLLPCVGICTGTRCRDVRFWLVKAAGRVTACLSSTACPPGGPTGAAGAYASPVLEGIVTLPPLLVLVFGVVGATLVTSPGECAEYEPSPVEEPPETPMNEGAGPAREGEGGSEEAGDETELAGPFRHRMHPGEWSGSCWCIGVGHPTNEVRARMLRLGEAQDVMIRAAEQLQCSVCQLGSRPRRPFAAKAESRAVSFGTCVHIDLKYEHTISVAKPSKPKFEQPIFGANYLAGSTRPLPGTENDQTAAPLLGGDTVFYLTFRSGGCNTFLQLLFQLLSEVQAQNSQNTIAQAAQEGRLNQVAYVDPSDPSVLYLSQPTAVAGSEEQTNFQMDAPSAPPPEGHPQPARGGGNQQCVIC
eukprot:s3807_g3.t1